MNAYAKKHTNAGMDTNTNTNLLSCMFVLALVLVWLFGLILVFQLLELIFMLKTFSNNMLIGIRRSVNIPTSY